MTDFSNKTAYPIASPPPSDGRIVGATAGYLARDFAVSDFVFNLGGGIYGCPGPVVRIADNFAGLQLGNNGTAANNAHIALQTGDVVFFNGNYGAGTERMRIKAGGLVGLGTGSPSLKLHVAADSVATNLLGLFDSGSGGKSWGIGPSVGTANRAIFGIYNYTDSRALLLASDTAFQICGGGGVRLNIDSATIRPGTDNTHSAGGASQRFTVVFAVSGTINTSDAREKSWIGGLTEAHLRAARRIEAEIGLYQWLEELARKGEAARIHVGVRAQAVIRIMMEEGLEATQGIDLPAGRFIPERDRPSFRHAFLCFDTWEEVREPIMEQRMVKKRVQIEEMVESKVLGADGGPVLKPRKRWITREEMETVETGEFKVTPAGNRFGIRPDQLALFLAAAQGARLSALEAKLTE